MKEPKIYVMLTADGSYYVGETTNLKKRLRRHKQDGMQGTIIAWEHACANKQARQRQEQAVLARLVAMDYPTANSKCGQTVDYATVAANCNKVVTSA